MPGHIPQGSRHSPVTGAYPPKAWCAASTRPLLWTCPQGTAGVEAAMVRALEGGERKHKTGRALLAIGGVALLVELWTLWLEAGSALNDGAADSVGWLGAVG